jgi:translocation and assembly module TamB
MAKQRMEPDRDDEGASRQRDAAPQRGRGGSRLVWFGSRLFVVALLLGSLAYFAPLLVTSTGIWKSVLAAAAPQLAGKIDAAALQLAWLAPIEIKGLVIRDPAGQPLAEVASIKSRKSLLEIALNRSDLGVFDVVDPKATITLRAAGSNVEDLLAVLPKSESQSGQPVGIGLQLVNGTIALDDQIAGRQWQLEGVALDLHWTAAASQPKTGKLAAAVRPLGAQAAGAGIGQIAAEFTWQPGPGETPALGAGQAQLTVQGLPTELVEGGLRRFVADLRPQGPLTMQVGCAWAENGQAQQIVVQQLATPGLSVAAPGLFGADRPTWAIASARADLQLAGGLATIRELRLESNLVQIAGQGAARLVHSRPAAPSTAVGAATEMATLGDIDLTGQLDLAELARQFPATLRLKPDTQLTSGVVQVSLISREGGTGRQWQGKLQTDQIRAVAAGRPVQFDQPLALEFTARQTPQGPVIDQLSGQASFLRLSGRGTLDEGGITASADLNQLVIDLGRLIDWGQTRLAGSLAAELKWKREPASGWVASGDAQVRNFELSAPGMTPWREPHLQLAAIAQGELGAASLDLLRGAKLTVEAGADHLVAELTDAVKSPSATSVFPCQFTLQGDLASWSSRLQPFIPLSGWQMAGAIHAAGTGRLSARACELGPTIVQLGRPEPPQPLVITGPGVAIREPLVKIESSGAWDQEHSALTLGSTTLACSALALRADGLRLIASADPSLVGLIDFRGDLARLSSWLSGSGSAPGVRLAGALTGRVEIGYRGQALAANWTTDVEQFAYRTPPPAAERSSSAILTVGHPAADWGTLWEEPRISFSGQGTFDPATTSLKIERTSLATENAGFSATGTLHRLTSTATADLVGEVTYDLAQVTRQIQSLAARQAKPGATTLPYALDTLQLSGKQKRPFVLKGPLISTAGELVAASPSTGGATGLAISEALHGEASLGWEGAQYVGLVAGPAEFRARLAAGVVDVGPLDIPLSEGRLKSAPRIVLSGSAPSVILGRGPLVENVRISPEMCSLWLKFVAPLLAETTRAEGKFSVSLEGADVPIDAPLRSSVAGTLAIHTAQIGPGPLAQQYVGMYRQVRSFLEPASPGAAQAETDRGLLVMPQQDVRFEVHDGAVFHRGLQLTIGNTVITTSGSVGIESQELNLVTSIPLQESWFKGNATLAAAFQGQALQIPVRGTLSQPRLDLRAIQDLGKQFAGAAVQGALNKQLERGQGLLDKQIEKGQGALQNELSKGLNKLFGPLQPQPKAPQPKVPKEL